MGPHKAAVEVAAHQGHAVVLPLGKDLRVVADGVHLVHDDLIGLLHQLFGRAVDVGHTAHDIGVLHLVVDVVLADVAARQHPAQVVGGAALLLVVLVGVDAGVQGLGGTPQGLIAHGPGQLRVLQGGDGLIQGQQTQSGDGDGAV